MSRHPLGPGPLVPAIALVAWLVDLSWQGSTPGTGFLSAPHLAAMMLVALAGASLAWGRNLRAASPILMAARVAAIAATLALPLDAWWHQARAPVPEVLTPPHTVTALALGLLLGAASWGALSHPALPSASSWRRTLPVALLLAWMTAIGTEYLGRPNLWHGAEFYQIAAAAFPVVLVSVAIRSQGRWPALKVSVAYLGLLLLVGWGLAVWPVTLRAGGASPAPLVTPAVPLLLVLPAAGIDWLVARAPAWRAAPLRQLAAAAGTAAAFVALLATAHWPTGDLLLGPAGWTVGADRWPYHAGPGTWRIEYWTVDPGRRDLALGLSWAVVLGTASVLAGYWAGRRLDSGGPT